MIKSEESHLDFPLSLLQTFFVLAECQDFGAAAVRLRVDSRTVAKRLDDLEARFRTVLFTSTEFFELSPTGESLLSAAIPVLGQLMNNFDCGASLDSLDVSGIRLTHLQEAIILADEGAYKRIYEIPSDGAEPSGTNKTQALRLHIKKLESLLGARIFEGWSSVKLTPFGSNLISEIRPSLETIRSLRFPMLNAQESHRYMMHKHMKSMHQGKILLIISVAVLERRKRLSDARKRDLRRMKLLLALANEIIEYLVDLGATDTLNAIDIEVDFPKPNNDINSPS